MNVLNRLDGIIMLLGLLHKLFELDFGQERRVWDVSALVHVAVTIHGRRAVSPLVLLALDWELAMGVSLRV